jgi:3-methyladenine DNA glycosylase AlkD
MRARPSGLIIIMRKQSKTGARPSRVSSMIVADLRGLSVQNAPNMRRIRREYSRKLENESAQFIHGVARELLKKPDHCWIAYELIRNHRAAFQSLAEANLERLGRGINSWWSVDSFARTLAGPAWLNGQVSDRLIHRWARSDDRWWRRAALVSTVALNVRSHGGAGDARRTLGVCRRLAGDHDDMVVKAMSWALRALVVYDPDAVRDFLIEYEGVLAARAKREVRSKLATGLKNPRPKSGRSSRSTRSG